MDCIDTDTDTDADADADADASTSTAERMRLRAYAEAASVVSTVSPSGGCGRDVTLSIDDAFRWLGDGPRSADREGALTALLGHAPLDGYDAAIAAVRGPLTIALEAAARLPDTRSADGLVAPAGTGLHRLCGAPARAVATWRDLPHGLSPGLERDALLAYPAALAASGYADVESLQAGLPGALLLGLLLDLFVRLERPGERTPTASAVRAVFSDVLDLGDTLALSRPGELLDIAAAQVACGRARRARRLLATHLERVPHDVEVALEHARLRLDRDRDRPPGRATREAVARAVGLAPDDTTMVLELARVQRERGDLRASAVTLKRLRVRRPDAPGLEQAQELTDRLVGWHAAAERPDTMPSVSPDAEERRNGRFRPDTLAAAAALYERHGTLAVTDAFDPTLLTACHDEFLAVHRERFAADTAGDALNIGDRRFQVSLTIAGAFNDAAFYANGFVLPLVRRLLDEQAIVGSAVCATSLPGARAQHWHKDHRAPFTRDADDEPIAIPPVAVTVMIPLVTLDETVGTTEVRKGSHRRSVPSSARLPVQRPLLPFGGFFLMDLALSHAGQANRSERVRPVVNMQYTRRWFVDNKNFLRQRPLEIPIEEWQRVPREHRSLFDWACQPGGRVGR